MTGDKASQPSRPRATTMDEYNAKQEAERAKDCAVARDQVGRGGTARQDQSEMEGARQGEEMITGAQITAARALLGWSIQDLARHAGMEIADVQEAETSAMLSNRQINDLAAIQQALEDAGIDFIDSVGVELRPPGINTLG